jgi:DNA-binding response OmpR family regulator
MSKQNPVVLIIDDDEMIGAAMERALRLSGYETLRADGGKKGLKMAIEQEPDLIILDYNMPDLNGLNVLKKLRDDAWGSRAKVIFATNVYDLKAVNLVLQLGVRDYVMKSDMGVADLIKLVGKYVAPAAEAVGTGAAPSK